MQRLLHFGREVRCRQRNLFSLLPDESPGPHPYAFQLGRDISTLRLIVLRPCKLGYQARGVLQTDKLEAIADRGYFNSPEILACHEAGIAVTLPKPMTSGAKSGGRFGKQDFVYLPDEDVYRCPGSPQRQ